MFTQETRWLQAVDQKKKIEGSPVLAWVNRHVRIPLSISAQRDRFFLRFLPRNKPQQQILDVGCGSGRRYLTEFGVVSGVDLTPSLLEEAKTIYANVLLHDILDMSTVLGEKRFDVVTSSDVIGHIPFEQKDRLYDEIAKVTKIGGLSLHFIECQHDTYWTNMVQRKWPDLFQKHFIDRVGHIGMEPVDQILKQFQKRGFEIVHLEKVPGFFPGMGHLAQFNSETFLPVIPGWMKVGAKLDTVLSGNIFAREILNIVLRPVVWIEDLVTPVTKTTAVMVAAKRIA